MGSARCFDACFDCEVLWRTFAAYAEQNSLSANDLLNKLVQDLGPCLSLSSWQPSEEVGWERYATLRPSLQHQQWDVEMYLKVGELTEALVILEAERGHEGADWA